MSEETYSFLAKTFDVSKAKAMIEANDFIREGSLVVNEAQALLSLHEIDSDFILNMSEDDLDKPVILAEVPIRQDQSEEEYHFSEDNLVLLIDGWHRVKKALEVGRKTLPAVMIEGSRVIIDD